MDVVTLGMAKANAAKQFSNARKSLRIPAGEGPKPYKNGLSNGTDLGANSQKRIIATHRVTDLTVKYGNFYASGGQEAAGPNEITVRASVLYNNTYYPLWFGGRRDAVIQPGAIAESDPSGIDIPEGTQFYIMTFVTVSSTGQKWGLNSLFIRGGNYGEGYETSASPTDKTGTGGLTMASNTIGYGPLQVLSRNTNANPYVAIIGDSISDGTGDTSTIEGVDGYERGWVVRGLIPDFPLQVLSQPGGQASQFNYSSMGRRMSIIGDAEVAIVAYGANDLNANKAFAQLQASLQYIYDYCAARGMRVFGATITPKTTSTDGFTTVANQTVAYSGAQELIRTQINDWIRSKPTPLRGFFETADAAESARNSGKWRVDLGVPCQNDGLHPLSVIHAAMGAAISRPELR